MRPRWQILSILALAALTAAPAAPAASQEPLATVNGEPITREALTHRLIDLSTLGVSELEQMVNEALLFQAAKKQGISVSDAEIDARIAEIKQKLNTDELFGRYLAGQEVTAEGLRQKLRVKILVEKFLGDKVQVTDEDVKQAYEGNKASFESPETVTLRMILTKTKERADEAMKRLDAGENFTELAKQLSDNAYMAETGGLLPRPLSRSNLSPALADAAFATGIGKYSQPIQTPDGYYILKVEARNAATSQSFDDVKDAIRAELREIKLQNAWLVWLQDARKQAAMERKWQP